MRSRILSLAVLALVLAFGSGWSFSATQAQRRSRPSRRATNPVRPQPQPTPPVTTPANTDARIVSTADDPPRDTQGQAPQRRTARQRAAEQESEEQRLRRTVDNLSHQVERITEQMNQMRDDQRTLVMLERLSRAEQRAEGLRTQLREVMQRESDLQGRAEQLEFELLPESIERRGALTGSTRPELLRDQLRRQLESERDRVRRQLEQLAASRARLEMAIASADAEVDRLRERTGEAEQAAEQTMTTGAEITPATPTPTPTPPADDIITNVP